MSSVYIGWDIEKNKDIGDFFKRIEKVWGKRNEN